MSEVLPPLREDADVKAWFYLDRWRDIEDWAALRPEARRLLNQYLLNLAPYFEQLGAGLDAEDDNDLQEDQDWRWLGLRRRSWQCADLQAASIGLQWYPDKLLTPADENEWPFLGVYVEVRNEDGELRRAIANELASVRSRQGGRQRGNYLFWRYVRPADGAQAVDPHELARRALEGFRELWDAAAPILDAALAAAGTAPAGSDPDPQAPSSPA